MKPTILFFLTLGFHSTVFASDSYEINATVTDPASELSFPAFKVSVSDQFGTSSVDGCTYTGKLTEQSENSLKLEATMECDQNDTEFKMKMPVFVLSSKGDSASYETGESENDIWKYSVEVKPVN